MTLASPPLRSRYDDPLDFRQTVFGFRGRISRKGFWLYGVFGPLLCSVMADMLSGIVRMPDDAATLLTWSLLLWPCLAVSVKRWHDRDKSGWWMLILLVPVIGLVWMLAAHGFLRGTVGANRFGPDGTERS